MRNLKNVVAEYLGRHSDYAVQITGPWGYGKTFFYRSVLEEVIAHTPCVSNNSKNYKPVYISLFGLKSVDDIATKIVVELFQSKFFSKYYKTRSDDKKTLKLTQSVFKLGLRGFLNFHGLGSLDEYMTDIRKGSESVLDSNELVICFDDLERMNSVLDINDFAGYVNSLVDERIKVLIISNEDLLLKEDSYKFLKEKIVGITVEYVPEIVSVLTAIIESKYSTFPVFARFLASNLDSLIKITTAVDCNFRHVIYAIDTLQAIYSRIKTGIIDVKDDICEKVEEELPNIALFSLAVSAEYKASRLKYSDIEEYMDNFWQDEINRRVSETNSPQVENEPTYLDVLLSRYLIKKDDYKLYSSIFYYVTGHSEFDIEIFKKEFIEIHRLDSGDILPQYSLMKELSYSNVFDLTDEKYAEKTHELIGYGKDGAFRPSEYLTIMHFAERFDNVLKIDLEAIRDDLLKGLISSIPKIGPHNHYEITGLKFNAQSPQISQNNKILAEKAVLAFQDYNNEQKESKCRKLRDFFYNRTAEFRERFYKVDDIAFKEDLASHDFVNYIAPADLVALIKESTNSIARFIVYFLSERYKRGVYNSERSNFTDFLKLLRDSTDEMENEGRQFLKVTVLNEFISDLEKVLKRPEIQPTESFED